MEKLIGSIVGLLLVAGVAFGIKAATGYYDDNTKTCTIAGKDRTTVSDGNGNSHSQMRVYTEDCGSFEVSDSLIKGKFNSADTFGRLKDGHRYELKYHGWRIGWLSSFPTITEAKEVG